MLYSLTASTKWPNLNYLEPLQSRFNPLKPGLWERSDSPFLSQAPAPARQNASFMNFETFYRDIEILFL